VNDHRQLLGDRFVELVKAKMPSKLTPQISQRAYERYEQRGGPRGWALQDLKQAEREIRGDAVEVKANKRTA